MLDKVHVMIHHSDLDVFGLPGWLHLFCSKVVVVAYASGNTCKSPYGFLKISLRSIHWN